MRTPADEAYERQQTRERYVRLREAAYERGEAIRARIERDTDPGEDDLREVKTSLDEVEHFNHLIISLDQAAADQFRQDMANGFVIDSVGRPVYGARVEYNRPLPEGRSFREIVERDVPEELRGLSLGKAIRGVITGSWKDADRERRAMSGLSQGAGGYLLPQIFLPGIVDLARPLTQVARAGARVVPLENRNAVMAKWVQDPTLSWRAENDPITASDGALGQLSFAAHTLSGMTALSREIIEDTDLSGILESAYAAAFAQAWDNAALFGTGASNQPLGLFNNTAVTDKSALGANGVAFVWSHLLDAVGSVRGRNEAVTAAIMNPRSALSLGKITGTDGHYLSVPPYVADVPRLETGIIPITQTQGTANNASTLFCGDFRHLFLGVRTEFGVRVFEQVGAANGQVSLIAWFRGDVQIGRPSAFAIRTGLLP